jgi:4-cresol dehydrogenase (hydroxylating)
MGASDPPQGATCTEISRYQERVTSAGIAWDWPSSDRSSRSTDGRPRLPAGIIYPTSTEDVQLAVRIAGELGVALYPISRGCNWGYGDASPPYAGQVVMDLGRMNRILEVNEELGYCVIEPGVTQGQLYQELQRRGGQLWMDATGAGPNASVVGNTLDRGFGHTRYGDHFQTACGMDVVLPDGELLRTGFGHYDEAKADRVFPYGVGPFIDGLFAQSNLGVVTRLGLWLQPKPEAFCAFFFSAKNDDELEALIGRLAPLRRAGLLQSAVHIANDLRVMSARTRYPFGEADGQTPLPDPLRAELRRRFKLGAWNGLGALTGSKATVKALRRDVKRALRGFQTVFLDDRKLGLAESFTRALRTIGLGSGLQEQLDIVKPAYDLLKGQPGVEHLKGALWRVRGELEGETLDPLAANAGLIWVSPVLPMTGANAREVLTILDPIYREHGFDNLVTFTMLNERAMVAVTNVAFDTREPEENQRAAACYAALSSALKSQGYLPYRTGPLGYDKLRTEGDAYWTLTSRIKAALDPTNVIAPGRYLAQ